MKTNANLVRQMGDFNVIQRTQDGMFNATELMKQWNEHSGMKKEVSKYFENPSTKEFINALIIEENQQSHNSLIINDTQKSAIDVSGIYMKKRGGIYGGGSTWMHPLLFIDFAMWINPTFKIKVLKFVYDELIKYRNDAGDAYREMSSAIAKIVPKKDIVESISKTAQALNFVCFNKHETAIRNKQDENAMKELVNLEKEVTLLINVGHLKSLTEVLDYLRMNWNKKYRPQLFA